MNLFARLRFSEVVLLTFVIAIAAMLIVPLPTPMLDLLLVLNIAFSILLLLVGLYVANSAALYTFPTVLLLSTLFRLGLNVASSRLILSQGDAGRVIEAFGTFLIRGEIVVGIIGNAEICECSNDDSLLFITGHWSTDGHSTRPRL